MFNYSIDESQIHNYSQMTKYLCTLSRCGCVIIAVSPSESARIITKTQLPEIYLKTLNSYASSELISFRSTCRGNSFRSSAIIPIISNSYCGLRHLRISNDITHPIQNEPKTLFGYFSSLDDSNEHNRCLVLSEVLTKCLKTSNVDPINYREEVLQRGLMSVLKPSRIQNHFNPMKTPYKRYLSHNCHVQKIDMLIQIVRDVGETNVL